MHTYEVTVTVVDYYGYAVYDYTRTVQADSAAAAKKLCKPAQVSGWPRYRASAKRQAPVFEYVTSEQRALDAMDADGRGYNE